MAVFYTLDMDGSRSVVFNTIMSGVIFKTDISWWVVPGTIDLVEG